MLTEVSESVTQNVFRVCAGGEHRRSLLSKTLSVTFAEIEPCTLICSRFLMHLVMVMSHIYLKRSVDVLQTLGWIDLVGIR